MNKQWRIMGVALATVYTALAVVIRVKKFNPKAGSVYQEEMNRIKNQTHGK